MKNEGNKVYSNIGFIDQIIFYTCATGDHYVRPYLCIGMHGRVAPYDNIRPDDGTILKTGILRHLCPVINYRARYITVTANSNIVEDI